MNPETQRLIEDLTSPSLSTVVKAIEALGELKARTSVPNLINLLLAKNCGWIEAKKVVETLGKIADPRAIQALRTIAVDYKKENEVLLQRYTANKDNYDGREIAAIGQLLEVYEEMYALCLLALSQIGTEEAIVILSELRTVS